MENGEFNKYKLINYWVDSSDDDKMSFQRTCTPDFSADWIELLKNKRLWIKGLLEQ